MIREALEGASIHIGYLAAGAEQAKDKAIKSLTLIDELLAELDSAELLTSVDYEISEVWLNTPMGEINSISAAQAVINVIKGIDTSS